MVFLKSIYMIIYSFRKVVPGACFLKVPKRFGRMSGDIILFVSSKRRRLKARNFAVIFIFISSTTKKRPALQNKQVVVFRMAFRARKVLGTFEKLSPGLVMVIKFGHHMLELTAKVCK